MVCLWVVGGVPIEMEKFRLEFKKKTQKRRLMLTNANGGTFEDWLNDIGDFSLSGCDILHYRRSSMILTLVGAVLTYTLFLLNSIE